LEQNLSFYISALVKNSKPCDKSQNYSMRGHIIVTFDRLILSSIKGNQDQETMKL